MKPLAVLLCALLIAPIGQLAGFADDASTSRAERVKTGLTLAGAAAGIGAGISLGVGFSQDAIDTPLSNTLLISIPVAAVGAGAGALAGRWMADVLLRHRPSPLFAVVEGAGVGLVAGAFVGGLVFPATLALGIPILEVPEGYWGEPPIPAVAMALVAGAFWGGLLGAVAGAIMGPLLSLYLGF